MASITAKRFDITTFNGDAIVNAANESLMGGGGVDGAIHLAAGPQLDRECRLLGGCKAGEAKITSGCSLKAKYIIHTVGPIYSENSEDESKRLLENCYRNCLDLARANSIKSIAFCSISTGIFGYPKDKAAKIAVSTTRKWLADNDGYNLDVMFSCFDNETLKLYKSELRYMNGI